MSKKLLFAAIASTITATALADTKTIPTQGYVDNTFQTKIPANSINVFDTDLPGLVSTTDTPGVVGEVGFVTIEATGLTPNEGVNMGDDQSVTDTLVPSLGFINVLQANQFHELYNMIDTKQEKIWKSGYINNGNNNFNLISDNPNYGWNWLGDRVKGTGLVTKTNGSNGEVGERKIFEASDVSGYHATGLTQYQKDVQDISIPTVGAMMSAIANSQVTLPTGTANSIVMYNANGNIGGSRTIATSVGTNTSATTIPTTGAVVTGLNTKQNKMTCTRYVENAEHTDANCLLWSIN